MSVWPLRFRELDGERFVFADDAGGFFFSDGAFLARYASAELTEGDAAFLHRQGHAFGEEGDLAHTAFSYRWAARAEPSAADGLSHPGPHAPL